MKFIKSCTSILFLSLFFLSCQKENAVTLPDKTFPLADTIIKDISYGANSAYKLDLGLPGNRTVASKLVVVIHGGGWSTGDKGELNFMTDGLKKRNFVVANINYRLSPQSNDNYKMQLDDIDSAINFLRKKSSFYIFGTDKIYITGHSAGAHLALSYAYTRNADGKIKAAAGMASPTNLPHAVYYNTNITAPLLTPYLGVAYSASSDALYKKCSPYFNVNANTVPAILFQGDLDFIVQKEQANLLSAVLTQNSIPNKVVIYPFTFHDWWTNGDFVKNTLDETAAWFNKY
ncbi:MAG: alpha/beta hydrolase [Ginsengibacter sp.]